MTSTQQMKKATNKEGSKEREKQTTGDLKGRKFTEVVGEKSTYSVGGKLKFRTFTQGRSSVFHFELDAPSEIGKRCPYGCFRAASVVRVFIGSACGYKIEREDNSGLLCGLMQTPLRTRNDSKTQPFKPRSSRLKSS